MKIHKHERSMLCLLTEKGQVELHLPYYSSDDEIPRHVREFLILLGMWQARDKQLIKRIEVKIKEDK